ncbi:molybdopterin oxidoreductase family protein [Naumannella halotolerans]|uniref:molybdopterin oxidoreductase family protein n=1 Tax=Naumannella halotolerans TaxID=993414 RepID=UPI00370DCB0E
MATTASHCPYCALQCAMSLQTGADLPEQQVDHRPPVGIGSRDFPTNRGGLCKKGWTSAELINSAGRVTTPLRRVGSEFVPVGWEQALDDIADRLRSIGERHGKDAVGVFGGGGLTNKKAYQLGKFARIALGTSMIDYNGRFCMSSAAAAGNRAFGIDRGMPFPVSDLDGAQTILLVGSNVAATMPPFIGHLEGTRERNGLIVVDPRRSETARLTDDGGGLHLQPVPGTDLVLLLGITHIVLNEKLYDEHYVQTRTVGWEGVRRSVAQWWPQRVQEVTGAPTGQLREVAHRLAGGRGTYILTGRGIEQHVDGTDTVTAAINLSLLLGLCGRPGSGYGTLTGQGNGQGGREHGQKADQLPGYRKITDPQARAQVAAVWGVDPDRLPGPGVPATELLGRLGEQIKALLVHGSNVVISAPDAGAVARRLAQLDLLVVCDFFCSETAAHADYVLPVTQWAEEEGTMTNLEGRVLRRRRAIEPPQGVRSELWIMAELAQRLAAPGVWDTEAAAVFDELARASAGGIADYSGLSHELLDTEVEAYWPYPSGSAGTPRLFAERFAHPDGRAVMVPVRSRRHAPRPVATDELTLVTGRLLEHYQSGAQTRRVEELRSARPQADLQINPATAQRLGIAEGDRVRISNLRGEVFARAELSTGIRIDTVFLPFHFGGRQTANALTEAVVDPISAMPEFKRTQVSVRRADPVEVQG